MAKTFKKLPKQNLLRIPVLIEDTKSYSEYFEISELNRIFHAGKNGFLIRGSDFLAQNTEISIEVLDRFDNSIYASPVSGYSEGGSRLVSVEIYQKTEKGPGKLVILGTADRHSDGRVIDAQYRGKPNVRWVIPIQIEPQNQNTAQIRLTNDPKILVTERNFQTTRIDTTTVTDNTYTASLDYDYATHKSDGYAITMLSGSTLTQSGTPVPFFDTVNTDAYFTGSIYKRVIESSSLGTISVVSNYTTASVSMSLDKVLNETTAITNTPIKFGDKTDFLNPILKSGSFSRVVKGNDGSSKRTIEEYTSSVVFQYPSESVVYTNNTSSIVNFRIPSVQTSTGEISKVRVLAKEANSAITSFQPFTEFVPVERNLLVHTSSLRGDVNSGIFIERDILDNHWFGALTTKTNGDFNQSVYENSGSLGLDHPVTLITSSEKILEGFHADHTSSAVPYFIGTQNHYQLYNDVEYTLKYTAVYTPTHVTSSGTASIATYSTTNTGSVKTFLSRIGASSVLRNSSSVANNDTEPVGVGSISKYGLLVDTLDTRTRDKSLYERKVNFKVPRDGVSYLRFKVDDGFWHFGNIQISPALEKGFHPDEIIFDAETAALANTTTDFKVEFLNFEDTPIDHEIVVPNFHVSSSRLAKSLKLSSDITEFTFGAAGDIIGEKTASITVLSTNITNPSSISIEGFSSSYGPVPTASVGTLGQQTASFSDTSSIESGTSDSFDIYYTSFGNQSGSNDAYTSSLRVTATSEGFSDSIDITRASTGGAGPTGPQGATGATGDDGGAGPGVVYRGDWVTDRIYYSSSLRKDVVKGSNDEYYLCKAQHTSAASKGDPPDGTNASTYWEAFGATFSSVATDILFAQEVSVAQGMTLGTLSSFTEPNCDVDSGDATVNHDAVEPRIVPGLLVTGTGIPSSTFVASINSTTSFELTKVATATNDPVTLTFQPYGFLRSVNTITPTTGTGFWLDTAGNFRAGNSSNNYIQWDGSALTVRGTIQLTGGTSPTSTFRQDGVPTALAAGDIWYDTNDGNKPYVATNAGDDQVTSGEWVAVTDGTIATAQTAANTGVSNAATAQAAIDAMETQVVLDSDGMTLRAADGDPDLADFGTSIIFYDGSGDANANKKFVANSSGLTLYGSQAGNDYMFLEAGGLEMRSNNVRTLHITDNGINIGPSATGPSSGGSPSAVVGNISLHSAGAHIYGDATNTYASVTSAGLTIVDDGATKAVFGANTTITGGTITLRNTTNNNDKIIITENSFTVYDNNAAVASFAANTTITGGTITLRNSTNTDDKLILSENSAKFYDNNTEVASFGATTTIGDTQNDHVSIASTGISIKDGGTVHATFAANTTITGGTITLQSNAAGGGDDERVVIGSGNIAMYANDAKLIDIEDASINIGPSADAGQAVIGNVRLGSGGAFIYGAAVDDYVNVKSDGVDIYASNVKQASFGATTTIGNPSSDYIELDSTSIDMFRNGTSQIKLVDGTITVAVNTGAATTDSVVIAAGGVKIYDNSADYIHIDSTGLKVYESSTLRAQIGSTITLAPDVSAATTDSVVIAAGGVKIYDNSADYIHIDSDGLKVYESSALAAQFGDTVVIGKNANSHSRVEITSGGEIQLINKSSGGVDASVIKLESDGDAIFTGNIKAQSLTLSSDSGTNRLSGDWGLTNIDLVELDRMNIFRDGNETSHTMKVFGGGPAGSSNPPYLWIADIDAEGHVVGTNNTVGGLATSGASAYMLAVYGGNVYFSGALTIGGTVSAGGWSGVSAATATDVNVSTTTSTTCFVGLFDNNGGGTQGCLTDAGLTYNASTNVLTTTTFVGALTGDVTGNVSGTAGTAATVTSGTQSSITTCSNLVTVGTIGSGTWQGTAIASGYLDSDTMHLSVAQDVTGLKTHAFSKSGTSDPTNNILLVLKNTDATSNNYGALMFKDAQGNDASAVVCRYVHHGNNQSELGFWTRVSGGNVTQAMNIDSSQRVGIGTTSPSVKLDVYNSSGWGGFDLDGTSGGEFRLQKAGTTYANMYASDTHGFIINAQAGLGDIFFQSSGATKMTMLDSGRLGIGTTSPDTPLHVIGPTAGDSPYTSAAITIAPSNHTSRKWQLRYDDGGAVGNGFSLYESSNDRRCMFWCAGNGRVGIGTVSPSELFEVSGGNVKAVDVIATSDIRLKNVVGPLTNALSTVNKLNAIRFTWKEGASEDTDKEHIGFSAQEVLELVPEAVYGSEETEYGISYGKLVPVLVEAIKELTAEVEALKKKVGG